MGRHKNEPKRQGYLYVIHFTDRLGGEKGAGALHYIGYSSQPMTRFMQHKNGWSRVRIIEACHDQGIGMVLGNTFPVPDRMSERTLKRKRNAKFYCKYCSPDKYGHNTTLFLEKEAKKYGTHEDSK